MKLADVMKALEDALVYELRGKEAENAARAIVQLFEPVIDEAYAQGLEDECVGDTELSGNYASRVIRTIAGES